MNTDLYLQVRGLAAQKKRAQVFWVLFCPSLKISNEKQVAAVKYKKLSTPSTPQVSHSNIQERIDGILR